MQRDLGGKLFALELRLRDHAIQLKNALSVEYGPGMLVESGMMEISIESNIYALMDALLRGVSEVESMIGTVGQEITLPTCNHRIEMQRYSPMRVMSVSYPEVKLTVVIYTDFAGVPVNYSLVSE
jgi:hypothetical protein